MPSEPAAIKLRILLVCVSRLICDALEAMIGSDNECLIVGKAKAMDEALSLNQMFSPDLIIADPDLPEGTDVQFVEQLSKHVVGTPVAVLTLCTRPDILYHLLQLNIRACLTKDTNRDELIRTLKLVKNSQGQKIVSSLLVNVKMSEAAANIPPHEKLKKREQQVLFLVLQGKANKDIAEIMHVSPQSIRNYVFTIYRKFSVNTRAELILLFHQNRWSAFVASIVANIVLVY